MAAYDWSLKFYYFLLTHAACTVNVTFYTSISYSLTSINSHSVKGDTAVKVHSISIYTHTLTERENYFGTNFQMFRKTLAVTIEIRLMTNQILILPTILILSFLIFKILAFKYLRESYQFKFDISIIIPCIY